MLPWTFALFLIALTVGLLGYTGLAGAASGIARALFYLFSALVVISAVIGTCRTRNGTRVPRPPKSGKTQKLNHESQ